MGIASRIFQGTVVLGLLGTAVNEFVKSATATVAAKEVSALYARDRLTPSLPPPSPVVPAATTIPALPPAAAPPTAPPTASSAPAKAPLDEDGLLRLLVAGEFAQALTSAGANPALAEFVPGCELLVRFGAFRDSGDYVSARRSVLRAGEVAPRLASIASLWNCRLARLQKSLSNLGQCLASGGLAPPPRP